MELNERPSIAFAIGYKTEIKVAFLTHTCQDSSFEAIASMRNKCAFLSRIPVLKVKAPHRAYCESARTIRKRTMGSVSNTQRFKADTVAIIGAGPSGLAAAK